MDPERISLPSSSTLAEPTAALAPAASPEPAEVDGLLDRITELKTAQKVLETELQLLLDQLDAAFEDGLLDPSFSHKDCSFCWSAGRTTYVYPEVLKQREQALKAAQKDAIASGVAIAKSGRPFWTIRLARE